MDIFVWLNSFIMKQITAGIILGILFIFLQCNSNDQTKKNELIQSKELLSDMSKITCPECGHEAIEKLPTEVCQLKYECKKCKTELWPKEGDCCVFCSYGTHKCPSKQE